MNSPYAVLLGRVNGLLGSSQCRGDIKVQGLGLWNIAPTMAKQMEHEMEATTCSIL